MDMLFTPGRIGTLTLPNRLVRSATAERMVDADGRPRPQLSALYEDLARGGVGLIITGHMVVHPCQPVPLPLRQPPDQRMGRQNRGAHPLPAGCLPGRAGANRQIGKSANRQVSKSANQQISRAAGRQMDRVRKIR
jgi:hypothetical protein